MKEKITINWDNEKFKIDRYPDVCPICHSAAEFKKIGTNLRDNSSKYFLDVPNFLARHHLLFIINSIFVIG